MEVIDIFMAVIPSIVVAVVAYFLISKFLSAESKRHILDIKRESVKVTTPVRLQAFERLILLVERIDPVQVTKRIIKPGMTVGQIKMAVMNDIVNEYNHNITQQLYVSGETWEMVKKVKDDAMKLVTLSGTQINNDLDAIVFSKKILGVQDEVGILSNTEAIEFIKKEARKIF